MTTNPIILNTKHKDSFKLNNLTIDLSFIVKHHECKIKFKLKNSDNKYLAKLSLLVDIEEDKFKNLTIIKQHGSQFNIQYELSSNLSLNVNVPIYGYVYNIIFITDNVKSFTYNIKSDVSNRFVSYVNYLNSWWPPEAIAASIGVPPYSHSYAYNIINLAFWTTNQGPVDAALLWCNAITYVSPDNPWGNTTQQIQQAWINLYHQYGVKVLVSAFGATNFPTTEGADPIVTAEALAKFVSDNNLDGVDLDWEDNAAMETGKGVPWLISCTHKLRELLPSPYIISHAPQAPYFMGTSKYPDGGYLTVNSVVGSMIDFYNIQFYNQDSSKYDTYQTLFNVSDGWATNTAVKQIAANSVSKEKLVIGKGVRLDDYYNTGYVPVNDLANYFKQGVEDGYSAGFMGWQFSSDTVGAWSETLADSFI